MPLKLVFPSSKLLHRGIIFPIKCFSLPFSPQTQDLCDCEWSLLCGMEVIAATGNEHCTVLGAPPLQIYSLHTGTQSPKMDKTVDAT